jgi:hypothetical protein
VLIVALSLKRDDIKPVCPVILLTVILSLKRDDIKPVCPVILLTLILSANKELINPVPELILFVLRLLMFAVSVDMLLTNTEPVDIVLTNILS